MEKKPMDAQAGAGFRRPEPVKEITAADLGNGIYDFKCPPVGFHCYLVVGENQAVMVDTGIGVGSLMEVIRTITDLPVSVILTHGHPDHGGGCAEFETVRLWEADNDVYEKMASKEFRVQDMSHMPDGEEAIKKLQPTGPKPVNIADGESIDLGGRSLTAIYAPGHTHGSICISDSKTGCLFTGDNVQGRETAIREWNSSTIEIYKQSLLKIKALNPTVLYGGHGPNVNSPAQIDKFIACADDILNGAVGEERENRMSGGTCFFYEKDGVCIAYTKNTIR